MFRPSASSRRVFGIALALSVGTGIGLGAYNLGASADTPQLPRAASATPTGSPTPGSPAPGSPAPVTNTGSPTSAEASAASPLTLEEATAVAVKAAAPGRVVQWDEDNEPTGLRYDVTLLHDDGTTTDVEVDTVTGRVTSIDHDNDGD